jgi:hypothetical protein
MSYSIYTVIHLCKQISSLIQEFGYFGIAYNTTQHNSDGSNNKAQDYISESMDVYDIQKSLICNLSITLIYLER